MGVLRRLQQARPKPRPGERCELCTAELAEEHPHLVRLDTRSLLCACRPCYLLFTAEGSGGGRYRAVPGRYLALAGFALSGPAWDDLQIPVGVAFFFHNSEEGRVVAFYPSPAGATESLLKLDAWEHLVAANPSIPAMEPDVEALLIRIGGAGPGGLAGAPGGARAPECFVVPIDACYELVGQIRLVWRGFDGGQEARATIDEFFDRIRRRARPVVAPAARTVPE
ncbi:MAG: DUF5947 family protein [Acidimicrobiales bacterium]